MKTIVKELNSLDIADIEEALTKAVGEPVSIAEVDCTLEYHFNIEEGYTDGMCLFFDIGDDFFGADEIFDSEGDDLYWKGNRLSINEYCLPVNEVLNFDTSAFKSFEIEENSDD